MKDRKALLVMSRDLQQQVADAASEARVDWMGVETCCHARRALAEDPSFDLVITNQTLMDGSWYCILEMLVQQDLDTNLLVVVPAGCDASVIQSHGVFGILRTPFDASAADLIATAANDHIGVVQG